MLAVWRDILTLTILPTKLPHRPISVALVVVCYFFFIAGTRPTNVGRSCAGDEDKNNGDNNVVNNVVNSVGNQCYPSIPDITPLHVLFPVTDEICRKQPCFNGGTCTPVGGRYDKAQRYVAVRKCVCRQDRSGDSCEKGGSVGNKAYAPAATTVGDACGKTRVVVRFYVNCQLQVYSAPFFVKLYL